MRLNLPYRSLESHPEAATIPGVKIIRFESALFFANESALKNRINELLETSDENLRVILMDMQSVNYIDLEGSDVLLEIISDINAEKKSLHLVNMQSDIKKYLESTGVIEKVGEKNIYNSFKEAESKLKK